MKLEKTVKTTTKIHLHCGEWHAAVTTPDTATIALWHMKDDVRTRSDMTVSKESIEQLQVLATAILEALESEEK